VAETSQSFEAPALQTDICKALAALTFTAPSSIQSAKIPLAVQVAEVFRSVAGRTRIAAMRFHSVKQCCQVVV